MSYSRVSTVLYDEAVKNTIRIEVTDPGLIKTRWGSCATPHRLLYNLGKLVRFMLIDGRNEHIKDINKSQILPGVLG